MIRTMHLLTRMLFIAVALLLPTRPSGAAVVTNWMAFNDHVPGPPPSPGVNNGWGTAANATTYNMRGIADTPPQPTAGVLKDFATGLATPAYLEATATGSPDFFGSISYPDAGTPASNLFNGIVDLGNQDSAIGIRSSANSTVTLTFSNLNPALRYIFRGTAVRGGGYVRRWTLASLRGVDSFINAHQGANVYTMGNFPTGTMTNGQAAYNSGENRADGAVIGWDDIAPGADGVFTVKCEQYVDSPLPNGQTPDLGAYGYAFAGIMLAEVGQPVPVSITVQPPSTLNMEQNRTLALSAQAIGAPAPDYQWYKGNVPIVGATSRNYSLPLAQPADSGNYYVVASNFINTATSLVSVVTVTNDITPPTIVSVASIDYNTIYVCFDEAVLGGVASESSNYDLDGAFSANIVTASLRPDGRSAVLTLVGPVGESFTLGAYMVDLAGNAMDGAIFSTGRVVHLTPMDVGSPTAAGGTFSCDANLIELTAGGADIWGVSDQGHLALAPRVGEFDVKVRVVGLTLSDVIAKAGLIVRESTDADSRTVHLLANPPAPGRNLIEMGTRTNIATATIGVGSTYSPAAIPNTWLRLRRFENTFSGYRSSNGVDWILMGQTTQPYPATTQVGLAATAHNNSAPATLASFLGFGDFTYPGAALGITQQPVNTTIPENNTGALTVAAVATNAPQAEISVHWQTETATDGGNWTNILGGTSTSLPIGPVSPADNGLRYRAVVSVPGASVTSLVATITVVADSFPPVVTSVRGTHTLGRVVVRFNELMNAASLGLLGNYGLTDTNGVPLAINAATVGADNQSVVLTTGPQTAGRVYILHAQNMTDLVGNPLTPTNVTFQSWTYSRGFVRKEIYLGLSTSTVAISELRASPNYPDSPSIVRYGDTPELNTFDEFEGYGARMSGVFIPPVTGNYVFYMASDDNGELWLSTNSSPANIVYIAREPVYSNRRIWTGESAGGSRVATASPSGGPQANISTNISLVAGQQYYFETLMKEGGGGDNLAISWQVPGGPVPVNGTLPTGGLSFAALADPVGAVITITQHPASTNLVAGQTASFAVRASGVNVSGPASVIYQWQRYVGAVWQDISGANSSNYVTAALGEVDNGAQYRALVTIPGAETASSVATVSIPPLNPTLRSSYVGGLLNFSWDAPARLQCTTSLTPPVIWRNVTTNGETAYTVNPLNEFDINLDTAQAGGGGRTGAGRGTLTLSGSSVSVDVTYSGMSGNRNNSHFHAPGARGISAGIAYGTATLDSATGANTNAGAIKGTIPLVDNTYGSENIAAQIQDIRNGLWYLNIHSTTFGGGEIRGQVDPAGARFYRLISP